MTTTTNNNNNTTNNSGKCSDFSVSSLCRDLRNSPEIRKSGEEDSSPAVIIGGTGTNWKIDLPPLVPPPTLGGSPLAATTQTALPPSQPPAPGMLFYEYPTKYLLCFVCLLS